MKKVAIVGAGISGLYLANELNKNTEIDYKIFEKKDYLNLNEGYGIQPVSYTHLTLPTICSV